MLQRGLLSESMPGLVRSLTNNWLRRNPVLEIGRHWDCKCPAHLRQSSIVQHASFVLHDCAGSPFYNSVRLRSVGHSRFLQYALGFQVFWKLLWGILTASICTELLHLLAQLFFCKSLAFFPSIQGLRLEHECVLIWTPHGIVNEAQHVWSSSNGCFQWTAYVRVH